MDKKKYLPLCGDASWHVPRVGSFGRKDEEEDDI
jgi:hypothetical protein